jgi:probable rRNA maturation factor
MMAENRQGFSFEVQYACSSGDVPDEASFHAWALAALDDNDQTPAGLVIRVVDEAESRALNKQYRGKNKPTNVLSFPFETPAGIEVDHLGDVVICAAVVGREAAEQHKPSDHHWAHMVVHGVLHLRGYDHQDEQQAGLMEALEKQILKGLGIADPYSISDMAV